jgi:hypothetical protein
MQQHDADSKRRRPYHPPELVDFGRLRDLTASGSGTKTENKGSDVMLDKMP